MMATTRTAPPRRAPKPVTAVHAPVAPAAPISASAGGESPPPVPPTISSVEILWSQNPMLEKGTFRSLWDADAALARAAAANHPPSPDGHDLTGFRIVWSDGKKHEGHVVESPTNVRKSAERGGMIRAQAEDIAAYLTSPQFRGRWIADHGDDDPAGLAESLAWGRDLKARLAADRAAHTDASAVRNVGKRIVSQRPTILAVDLKWSNDDGVPIGRFPSLAAADAALAAYFTGAPPKLGHYRITYFVTFTDGAIHQGRLELPTAAIPDSIQQGGILRHHLQTEGAKQRQEAGNLKRSLGNDAAIDAVALTGIELRRRIAADTRAQAAAPQRPGRRKAATADDEVPDLEATTQASTWIASMPTPPRLLPAPQDQFFRLCEALERSFGGKRVDWADPRVNAFVNYITRALRAEIPLLDPGDAAILWWRWREAVQGYQRHRHDESHGDLYYRALTIVRQVGYSQRNPGSVFQAFCPWRSLYFDLAADPQTQKARRARMEVDPWGA